jgi:pyruvate, water dikinase
MPRAEVSGADLTSLNGAAARRDLIRAMKRYIRSFLEIGLHDVGLVGGKTASLGELYSVLAAQGVAVPNGFAVTADAYRDALSQPGVADALHQLLDGLDMRNIRQLAARAAKARGLVHAAMDSVAA